MNKLINKVGVLAIVLSLFVVSCETVDFGDENVNPNSPTTKNGCIINKCHHLDAKCCK